MKNLFVQILLFSMVILSEGDITIIEKGGEDGGSSCGGFKTLDKILFA